MQPPVTTNDDLTSSYSTALNALGAIAHSYFFRGRLEDSIYLLDSTLHMIERGDVAPADRLTLVLLYGRVLIVDHLLHRGETARLFSMIDQARQIAEATENQQGIADAVSLLGQAHCHTTTVAIVRSGRLPFDTQDREKYREALTYLQQGLALQQELHDTRGISESLFCIGLIYQFWQQNDLAREHFLRAIQVAEQAGHVLEQAEPNRHLMVDALFNNDLDRALTHGQRALSFREATGFKPYQPLDHISLWSIYQKLGDTDRAQFHMQRAVVLADEMGVSTLVSSMLNSTRQLDAQTAEAPAPATEEAR